MYCVLSAAQLRVRLISLPPGVWDSRAFKKPVYQRDDLPSLYPETNAAFSPDEKYVIAGRSAPSRDERGGLVILNREGLDIEQTVSCEPGVGVVRVLWHPKINQVHISAFSSPFHKLTGCGYPSDRYGTVEWADQSSLLVHCVAKWRQVAAHENGQEDNDRDGKSSLSTGPYSYTTCIANVPR
jgi:hypothetical protein